MYKGRLTRIQNGSALRTDAVDGYFTSFPEVGRSFVLVGEALDPDIQAAGGRREVRTSPVVMVGEDGTFRTENSTYRLDLEGAE